MDDHDKKAERCETCRFWMADEFTEDHGCGHCHRYAPRLTAIEDDDRWPWPMTSLSAWCGDFRLRGGAQKDEKPPIPSWAEVRGSGARLSVRAQNVIDLAVGEGLSVERVYVGGAIGNPLKRIRNCGFQTVMEIYLAILKTMGVIPIGQ